MPPPAAILSAPMQLKWNSLADKRKNSRLNPMGNKPIHRSRPSDLSRSRKDSFFSDLPAGPRPRPHRLWDPSINFSTFAQRYYLTRRQGNFCIMMSHPHTQASPSQNRTRLNLLSAWFTTMRILYRPLLLPAHDQGSIDRLAICPSPSRTGYAAKLSHPRCTSSPGRRVGGSKPCPLNLSRQYGLATPSGQKIFSRRARAVHLSTQCTTQESRIHSFRAPTIAQCHPGPWPAFSSMLSSGT